GAVELGRQALAEDGLVRIRGLCGIRVFPSLAASFGAEVVESRSARELAKPCARGPATRVEPAPAPECALEGLAGEVCGEVRVSGHVQQVAVDVVQVLLGHVGEAPLLTECSLAAGP